METDYQKQGRDFIESNSLKLRVTEYPAEMQDPPRWAEEDAKPIRVKMLYGETAFLTHGIRYRITISREGSPGRISFDFWGSINDRAKRQKPRAYDVLACISGDVNCPESFKEFCSDYGYEIDSRKAMRTFKAVRKLSKKLRAFFTPAEIEQLQEIQ